MIFLLIGLFTACESRELQLDLEGMEALKASLGRPGDNETSTGPEEEVQEVITYLASLEVTIDQATLDALPSMSSPDGQLTYYQGATGLFMQTAQKVYEINYPYNFLEGDYFMTGNRGLLMAGNNGRIVMSSYWKEEETYEYDGDCIDPELDEFGDEIGCSEYEVIVDLTGYFIDYYEIGLFDFRLGQDRVLWGESIYDESYGYPVPQYEFFIDGDDRLEYFYLFLDFEIDDLSGEDDLGSYLKIFNAPLLSAPNTLSAVEIHNKTTGLASDYGMNGSCDNITFGEKIENLSISSTGYSYDLRTIYPVIETEYDVFDEFGVYADTLYDCDQEEDLVTPISESL
ncbi:hypothetical protein N9O57_00365 [bacterium]|nr:hypothetical protein [bacterium]